MQDLGYHSLWFSRLIFMYQVIQFRNISPSLRTKHRSLETIQLRQPGCLFHDEKLVSFG